MYIPEEHLKPSISELYHHGIKGQHWGVKRGPPYPLDSASAAYQKAGKKFLDRKSQDVTLKKGTQFQRIATAANSDFTKGVYMSYKNADKDLYKGVLGRMRVSWMLKNEGDAKLSEITLTSKKDIKLPSKDVRMDEFKKLYDSDPKGVLDLINEHERSRYGRKDMSYDYDYFKTKGRATNLYEKFNDSLAFGVTHPRGDVIQKYYDALQKRGYDGIPDENDIRLGTFKAQAPIILFDTQKTIGKVAQRELSAAEVYSAYNRSIGKKMVRDLIYQGTMGREKLTPNTVKQAQKYAAQLQKDKSALNKNYTMNDLAADWGKNRLTSRQIQKVSKMMDQGKSHDEAVAAVMGLGNSVTDEILKRFNL